MREKKRSGFDLIWTRSCTHIVSSLAWYCFWWTLDWFVSSLRLCSHFDSSELQLSIEKSLNEVCQYENHIKKRSVSNWDQIYIALKKISFLNCFSAQTWKKYRAKVQKPSAVLAESKCCFFSQSFPFHPIWFWIYIIYFFLFRIINLSLFPVSPHCHLLARAMTAPELSWTKLCEHGLSLGLLQSWFSSCFSF